MRRVVSIAFFFSFLSLCKYYNHTVQGTERQNATRQKESYRCSAFMPLEGEGGGGLPVCSTAAGGAVGGAML